MTLVWLWQFSLGCGEHYRCPSLGGHDGSSLDFIQILFLCGLLSLGLAWPCLGRWPSVTMSVCSLLQFSHLRDCFLCAPSRLPRSKNLHHRAKGCLSKSVGGPSLMWTWSSLRFVVLAGCILKVAGHFDRIGEADVPGPDWLRITTSNPSGLRGKESHLVELGVGIHCISESQLSHITLPRSITALKSQAGALHRQPRVLAGPPVACRPGSTWAGTGAGVLTLSDLPCQDLKLPWCLGEFESGRIHASVHYLGHVRLQVLNCYGFCRGLTWPKAKELTENLLSTATQHLVIGSYGPRIVCGDFNFSDSELDTFETWKHYGWVSAQAFAAFHWNHQIRPTCKGITERAFLWLSPEAQHLCRQVQVFDIFKEHSTVAADLALDLPLSQAFRWPLPALIPWDEVDTAGWTATALPQPRNTTQVWAPLWSIALVALSLHNQVMVFCLLRLDAANVLLLSVSESSPNSVLRVGLGRLSYVATSPPWRCATGSNNSEGSRAFITHFGLVRTIGRLSYIDMSFGELFSGLEGLSMVFVPFGALGILMDVLIYLNGCLRASLRFHRSSSSMRHFTHGS